MQAFANLKISSKILSLLSIFGIFIILSSVFTASKMLSIDESYSSLISNDAESAMLVVRADTRLVDLARLTYLIIVQPDSTARAALDKETTANVETFRGYLKQAMQLAPKRAPALQDLSSQFEADLQINTDIRAKLLAGDRDGALKLALESFIPKMAVTRANFATLTNATMKSLEAESDKTTDETHDTIYFTFGGISIVFVTISVVAVMISKNYLSNPVMAIGDIMTRLAQKEYNLVVPATERRDEIGAMARAVDVFRDGMMRADAAAAQQEEQRREREARATRLEAMTKTFDGDVSSILNAVDHAGTDMQSTASSMSQTAEEASRKAAVVAAAAEEASANVQTVAAASEQLASSIHEISRQVNQSAKVAADAAEQSTRTNALVQGLAQSAQRIGEVVNLINDIASQTNLLALNATIEAARAGDAGKGFAVVANEVKSLANQTGRATEEIAQQISAVQEATKNAVNAIQAIGTTIAEINQISSAIASAVEEQGAATQEIARNVQQAAAGTQQVTQNIGGVSEAAVDAGHAANDVLVVATTLARESTSLRSVVDGFLTNVRSA